MCLLILLLRTVWTTLNNDVNREYKIFTFPPSGTVLSLSTTTTESAIGYTWPFGTRWGPADLLRRDGVPRSSDYNTLNLSASLMNVQNIKQNRNKWIKLTLALLSRADVTKSFCLFAFPSHAINSCVLYASSGHFFRLGNGGSLIGPEFIIIIIRHLWQIIHFNVNITENKKREKNLRIR